MSWCFLKQVLPSDGVGGGAARQGHGDFKFIAQQTQLNARLQQQWRGGRWDSGAPTILSSTAALGGGRRHAQPQPRLRRDRRAAGTGDDGETDDEEADVDDDEEEGEEGEVQPGDSDGVRSSPAQPPPDALAAYGTVPAWMVQRALTFSSTASATLN